MVNHSSEPDRIRRLLKLYPRGLSTTEISRKLNLNRNSASKYLEILRMAGDIEMKKVCSARVYYLSQNVPISSMLSLTDDLIVVFDDMMNVKYANNSFLAFEGYKKEDILGKPLSELYLLSINDSLLQKIEKHDELKSISEIMPVSKGDMDYLFGLKAVKTILQNGSFATTLIFEDVTQKYKCEQELKKSQKLYSAVVEDQTEYIIRYTPERVISFANGAYCRAFGLKNPKGLILQPKIPKKNLKGILCKISNINPENPVSTFENPVVMPDGNLVWHRWVTRGIFNENNEILEYQSVGREIPEKSDDSVLKSYLMKELYLISELSDKLISHRNAAEKCDFKRDCEVLMDALGKAASSSIIRLEVKKCDEPVAELIQKGEMWTNGKLDDNLFNLIARTPEKSGNLPECSLSDKRIHKINDTDSGRYFENISKKKNKTKSSKSDYDIWSGSYQLNDDYSAVVNFITLKDQTPGDEALIGILLNLWRLSYAK